ncbi:Virginiamycin B lyase [Rosistilla oblonga]|uniref:beta-propeller fold lactonase family protein n=1 Tax=Rosistilla oblonga TaxID=2527990 RepID=UPI001188001A|nr:beta-propeller fold lactonase family protein [Rosistilla oblonga]QDV14378.1 Virginiamycin B lyase [Rosistilla oblonga]
MQSRSRALLLTLVYLSLAVGCGAAVAARADVIDPSIDRSPVDLALSPDGKWLVTANETSGSVSLIDAAAGRVVDELRIGSHPAHIDFTPDGTTVLATNQWSGELSLLAIRDGKLAAIGSVHVGGHPQGFAIAPDNRTVYVGLTAAAQVAQVDLRSLSVVRRIDVGNWPRYLTLSPDGTRLAVGSSGDAEIEVIDTATAEPLYEEPLANGVNIGHMTPSADGQYAYFTWMIYRTNPITRDNIQRGWILASRIGRVRLDGASYREAISLDVPEMAVADPHGLAISGDGQRLVASSSGTHELLVYRLPDLPFVSTGGPGDLIDRRLQRDRDRFSRIDVGGRPMGLEIASDNQTVYVANYLKNSLQSVDLNTKQVVREIDLGGPSTPSPARQGMAIFYDAQHSLDQWYSCHSCHQNGGINSRPMDTWNDGTEMTLKTVLPLYELTQTGPWTWHGWQEDLDDAMKKSFTVTMQGKQPTQTQTDALIEFLSTMPSPPNPFIGPDGTLSAAAQRGKELFHSSRAACADCHSGPQFTDGEIHDVGTGSKSDHYDGYNTPTLRGTYRKVRWMHSGRAKSLERVLTDLHSPEKVSGLPKLSDDEVDDLIAYLRSL